MYELTTIGDVTPVAEPAGFSVPTSALDRVRALAADVRAQRTGLIVGLAVGAVGALLYTRMVKR